jgi:hypothetical protein
MEERFDLLTRGLAKSTSRRQALKLVGGLVGGSALALFAPGRASAAPQTCVVCQCGTGKPCNVKSSFCTEVRGFPAEQTCSQACAKKGQNLCSAGQAFHCPHGCPA